MKKKLLRKIYIQKRNLLTQKEILYFQENIFNQIFNLDFLNINFIHVFLTIKSKKEINTLPLIEFLQKRYKKIIVSKTNFDNNTLDHFIYNKNTILKTNAWGIPEPVNSKKIDVKKIDLVFVPMLISDKKKYRVGYGKGFYDRFLLKCKKSVQTIGLNFFPPIESIQDINNYDISLNKVIYPLM